MIELNKGTLKVRDGDELKNISLLMGGNGGNGGNGGMSEEQVQLLNGLAEGAEGTITGELKGEIASISKNIFISQKTKNLVDYSETCNGLNYSSNKISESSVAKGIAIPISEDDWGETLKVQTGVKTGRFRGCFTKVFPFKGAENSSGFSKDQTDYVELVIPEGFYYFMLVYNTASTGIQDEDALSSTIVYIGDSYEGTEVSAIDLLMNTGRKTDVNKPRYILGHVNRIPFERFDGYTSAWNTATFNDYYQLFHSLYTEYSSSDLGFEEIVADIEYLSKNTNGDTTVPTEISSINNGGMYLWHLPPIQFDGHEDGSYQNIKIFLSAGIHGGEKKSILATYILMKKLLESTDDISTVLRTCDIWFMPMLNPWGIENNNTKNWNDVNLNRDFQVANWKADPSDSANTEPLSQYETRCTTYWLNKIKPHMAIDHHCFSGSDGGTKALQWGTSGYPSIVSLISENIAELTPIIRREFPDKFSGYNFAYGHATAVSKTSGTLSRWFSENDILGCTIECPMHVRWNTDDGYIWGFDDNGESSLVSSAYFMYANIVVKLAEFTKNVLNDDVSRTLT